MPSLGVPEGGSDASRSLRFPALLPDRAAPGRPHLLGLRARRDRLRPLPERERNRRSAPGAAAGPAPAFSSPRRSGARRSEARRGRWRRSSASSASASRTRPSTATPLSCCAPRRNGRYCRTCSTGREMARLLAVTERDRRLEASTSQASDERDRLVLALFAYAGLRRSELLGLDWDDVDLERRLIRVRKRERRTSARHTDPPSTRAALCRLPPRPRARP